MYIFFVSIHRQESTSAFLHKFETFTCLKQLNGTIECGFKSIQTYNTFIVAKNCAVDTLDM